MASLKVEFKYDHAATMEFIQENNSKLPEVKQAIARGYAELLRGEPPSSREKPCGFVRTLEMWKAIRDSEHEIFTLPSGRKSVMDQIMRSYRFNIALKFIEQIDNGIFKESDIQVASQASQAPTIERSTPLPRSVQL